MFWDLEALVLFKIEMRYRYRSTARGSPEQVSLFSSSAAFQFFSELGSLISCVLEGQFCRERERISLLLHLGVSTLR